MIINAITTRRLMRDAGILLCSVVVAWWLVESGVVGQLLHAVSGAGLWGSVIAGFFFTSLLTVAPATVVLGQIATENSIIMTAVLGGLGAVMGDAVIFYFIRDYIAEDIMCMVRVTPLRWFRWLAVILGVVIIASPLPDELGLTLLGLSKTKTAVFIPISFIANTLGIALVGAIAAIL